MTEHLKDPKTAKQMVTEARGRVESLTPEQVAADVKQGAMLVDLRESEECAQHGVIPGALHFPRGMLEFWADTLQQLGFKNVAHMDGGFERWSQEGRPVLGGHKNT